MKHLKLYFAAAALGVGNLYAESFEDFRRDLKAVIIENKETIAQAWIQRSAELDQTDAIRSAFFDAKELTLENLTALYWQYAELVQPHSVEWNKYATSEKSWHERMIKFHDIYKWLWISKPGWNMSFAESHFRDSVYHNMWLTQATVILNELDDDLLSKMCAGNFYEGTILTPALLLSPYMLFVPENVQEAQEKFKRGELKDINDAWLKRALFVLEIQLSLGDVLVSRKDKINFLLEHAYI
jgi:hypothetical protein